MRLFAILPIFLTVSCIDMLTQETAHYNSLYFEGGSWIEIDRMDNMRLDSSSNDFTLQFWVAGSDIYADEGPFFFSLIDPQDNVKLALFRDSGSPSRISTVVNSTTIPQESNIVDWSNSDEFYLISILFSDNQGIRVFVNDESFLDESGSSVNVSDTKLMVGTKANENRSQLRNFWYGYFDEIRLWNTLLADSIIQFQYDHPDKLGEFYRYTDDEGEEIETYLDSLIGLWRFNLTEATSTIVDGSGYGHTGFLYGTSGVELSMKGAQ